MSGDTPTLPGDSSDSVIQVRRIGWIERLLRERTQELKWSYSASTCCSKRESSLLENLFELYFSFNH
jgi:histone H3/H4